MTQGSIAAKQALDPRFTEYVSLARVARLATADAQGRPYVVPVCFAWADGQAYIALDDKPKSVQPTRLKRVRNILANPHVSLLVDSYSEDWSRLSYAMIGGEARLVEQGTEEHTEAVRLLRDKYPQYRSMRIEQQPVIGISATSAHTWTGQGQTTEPFRELDFAALARGRHVVRQYKPTPVPRELVEITIEAARWAPSPHGAQPWRFVIVTNDDTKEKLAEAMSEEWQRNLEMDGQDREIVMERLRKSRQRIAKSPVAIIPCLYLEDLHVYPDPGRQEAEVTMAVQSIGAAIQNMLLSAYSLGLDTGWMCAPLFCPGVVRDALGLPATLIPHALINMGYGAKDPPRRPHRPVEELIVYYD
jgi:coenzyme F420-0:L-glutamate ligase / coenzyme F420-1:gamma-L-glutamate ligase